MAKTRCDATDHDYREFERKYVPLRSEERTEPGITDRLEDRALFCTKCGWVRSDLPMDVTIKVNMSPASVAFETGLPLPKTPDPGRVTR